MIDFEFSLFSKKYGKDCLLKHYTIDYLNDWLSYESEIKHLFFFGEPDDLPNINISSFTHDSICILRHNEILNNNEKNFILALSIEDAYVISKNDIATLHIKLTSDFKKQPINENIIKYICNHIYNQTEHGIIKYGILQPLTDIEKENYGWKDEIEWTNYLVENKQFDISHLDFLYFSDFTYIYHQNSTVKELHTPIYLSNYNLNCYRISKLIDSVNNDIVRYKKTIKCLLNKKKELKKDKKQLYIAYRNNYIEMLSNTNKTWNQSL